MNVAPKILFTGHGGLINRGCEAILLSSMSIISRHLGGVHYSLLSRYPHYDQKALKNKFPEMSIHPLRIGRKTRLHPKRVVNSLSRKIFNHTSLFSMINKDELKKSDVLIHIGGDNFTGGNLGDWFAEFDVARSFGGKTVIWGASIGPFTNNTESQWAEELKKLDLITVREDLSVEYLASLGVVENVARVTDPAFLLPNTEYNNFPWALKGDEILVGIGLSDLLSEGGCGARMYLNAFHDLAKSLLARGSVKLILVPHVVEKSRGHDDLQVCQIIYDMLNQDARVHIINKSSGACEMKGAIKQCDFFVGARTHSTIAGLSSGVPTISLAYSRKAYGLNNDIFGHSKYVLHGLNISKNNLKKAFSLLEKDKIKIREQLTQGKAKLEEMADSAGKYLLDIMG